MMKMGNMCHCKATLWKIDPSDGSIVWRADRGADSDRIAHKIDGGDVYIYEGGDDHATHDILTRWHDTGPSKDRDWDTTVGGTFRGVAFETSGGVVWAYIDTNLYRFDDSDGSSLGNSGSLTAASPAELWEGPSGSMNLWRNAAPLSLDQFDSSFTIVATADLTASGNIVAEIGGDAKSNGFVIGAGPAVGQRTQVLDENLAVLVNNGTTRNIPRAAASTTKFVAVSGVIALVDIATIVNDWSVSIGAASVQSHASIMDASHNVYAVLSTSRVTRRGVAAGAEDWFSTTVTGLLCNRILIDSTNLYVIGFGVHSSVHKRVFAYDLATGALAWTQKLSDTETVQARDGLLAGGYLYVCGDRM